ncbi:hypothetical protein [Neisseria wadsworthii]|uniref:hypothetical protein n=1 Tax=Neisseria wadsworthii TaxID=607711 RepID=UPI001FD25652|nr:hypothetical protein [Neisseria wadsworthii]
MKNPLNISVGNLGDLEEFCKSLCLSESFQTGIVFGILSWFRHAWALSEHLEFR